VERVANAVPHDVQLAATAGTRRTNFILTCSKNHSINYMTEGALPWN
jgi:hypothetical protein